ncbi:hypothetical protein WEIDD23_02077 [Weissella sp. DD23]|uniref:hypothetical protein n=1 Tax=Weissella TaxID=46255 RepID=UPI000781DCF9|nr:MULTISPECIES: hypothetical protein [Weissella]KXU02499.1 hypothetical protein WEIDD23_02077 [Weissella sp. DD23]SJX69119.1 hypothetical protein FM131_05895 [Weissella confusa]
METLYQEATRNMNEAIHHYFYIVEKTNNFQNITMEALIDESYQQIVAVGKGLSWPVESLETLIQDLQRVEAVPFDVEMGVSSYVYQKSREYIEILFTEADKISDGFTHVEENDIKEASYLLPVWQAVLNIGSKGSLKKIFGTTTDSHISKPSAKKIVDYANSYFGDHSVVKDAVLQRIDTTLEGIVRDLVGRLLFESIVEKALKKYKVPFMRESEYSGIKGVVYNFRADFVIPNSDNPLAFIEVRKSSARHASLYAKDKMFSAINWKGNNPNMLGIVIAEGDWTSESLKAMSKVFDYVVPASSSEKVAQFIQKYLEGDSSMLKWIINFSISENLIDDSMIADPSSRTIQ